MPVTTSPTRSWYSSNIISRSASRMRCRMTCLAVCAAMRPKLDGVTSTTSMSASASRSQSSIGLRLLDRTSSPYWFVVVAGGSSGASSSDGSGRCRRPFSIRISSGTLTWNTLHLAGLAVDLDAHVTGGLRRLLVRRLEGVLQRDEEHLRVDRLLSLQLVDGFEDVFAHSVTGFQTMFDLATSSRGTSSSTPSSSVEPQRRVVGGREAPAEVAAPLGGS